MYQGLAALVPDPNAAPLLFSNGESDGRPVTARSSPEAHLGGPAVPVVQPALGLAGGERHFGRLRVLVAQHDLEALPELKLLVLHDLLPFPVDRIFALTSRLPARPPCG